MSPTLAVTSKGYVTPVRHRRARGGFSKPSAASLSPVLHDIAEAVTAGLPLPPASIPLPATPRLSPSNDADGVEYAATGATGDAALPHSPPAAK